LEEVQVLSIASVVGQEFSFALLHQAIGIEEERLAELTEGLVNRGLLREGSEEVFEFETDTLRTMVYADLRADYRRDLHARVARVLLNTVSIDPDSIFALAHHTYLGGLDPEAIQANRRAAAFATSVGSPMIARTHLERALECLERTRPSDTALRGDLQLALAVSLDQLGELARAESIVREALADHSTPAQAEGATGTLLKIYLARILSDQGRWAEAETLTAQLLERGLERLEAPAQLALLRLRGAIEYYRGNYLHAFRYHDRALEIARSNGNSREAALAQVRRANAIAMIPGHAHEWLPAYREACRTLIELGDRSEAGIAHLALGVSLHLDGRAAEALPEMREGLELAAESGNLRTQGWARFNIADLLLALREFSAARQENDEARQILGGIGDLMGVIQTHIVSAKIAIACKEFSESKGELLKALDLIRTLQSVPDEIEILLRLSQVALGQNNSQEAAERWRELIERGGVNLRPDLELDIDRVQKALISDGTINDSV